METKALVAGADPARSTESLEGMGEEGILVEYRPSIVCRSIHGELSDKCEQIRIASSFR
jgi:hypothetical protein